MPKIKLVLIPSADGIRRLCHGSNGCPPLGGNSNFLAAEQYKHGRGNVRGAATVDTEGSKEQ
jgi:hypothetical protein